MTDHELLKLRHHIEEGGGVSVNPKTVLMLMDELAKSRGKSKRQKRAYRDLQRAYMALWGVVGNRVAEAMAEDQVAVYDD